MLSQIKLPKQTKILNFSKILQYSDLRLTTYDLRTLGQSLILDKSVLFQFISFNSQCVKFLPERSNPCGNILFDEDFRHKPVKAFSHLISNTFCLTDSPIQILEFLKPLNSAQCTCPPGVDLTQTPDAHGPAGPAPIRVAGCGIRRAIALWQASNRSFSPNSAEASTQAGKPPGRNTVVQDHRHRDQASRARHRSARTGACPRSTGSSRWRRRRS